MSACVGVSSLTHAPFPPPLFFFLLLLCFEFSLEYRYILGYYVEHFHIRFIYFGELPNTQHLYRENLILTSFLISLCLFFLFAWCFHFAAGRNTDFGGVCFLKLKYFEVLKPHPTMTLPNYYHQINIFNF